MENKRQWTLDSYDFTAGEELEKVGLSINVVHKLITATCDARDLIQTQAVWRRGRNLPIGAERVTSYKEVRLGFHHMYQSYKKY